MKNYLAIAALAILLTGCQNTVAPTTVVPTQQQGSKATIQITRTQEEKVETEEDEDLEDEDSAEGEVMEVKKVPGKSSLSGNAYPGYALKMDTKKFDENVKKIQSKLNSALEYNLAVDGYFGQATKDAVMFVQEQNHVDVDGVVGPVTWDIIFNNIGGGAPDAAVGMDENAYPGYPLTMNTKKYDANVKKVQSKLNSALGYDLAEDGYFGQATKDAVMFVQEQNDVEVDGIVGPVTWGIIFNHIGGGQPDAAVGGDE
jgi:hypothetical protein